VKIKFQQFLAGKNHSWAIVAKSLARSFLSQGHQVDLVSTDGPKDLFKQLQEGKLPQYVPADLASCFVEKPKDNYDLQISYTLPHNFHKYLSGTGKKFGIWCYEFPKIPPNLAKYHTAVDLILPPSEFAKQGFLNAGVPESKLKVVHHGIDPWVPIDPYPLKNKKSFRFFFNLGQSHLRKNIKGTIEAYYKAFTKDDDVCLVAKISKPPQGIQAYESPNYVLPDKILQELNNQYSNHPVVELITDYVPAIESLYQACQVSYSLTHAEGFYMPGLEAMAAGKMVICPRYGGQLDYCNDDNSLLVEGKVGRCPRAAQYWEDNAKNTWFEPDLDDAAIKLRLAHSQYQELQGKFQPGVKREVESHQWNQIALQIQSIVR